MSPRLARLFVALLTAIVACSPFVLAAPHSTRTSRVDEVTAARKPIVRWKP